VEEGGGDDGETEVEVEGLVEVVLVEEGGEGGVEEQEGEEVGAEEERPRQQQLEGDGVAAHLQLANNNRG
jgi:hypothetical protein